VCRSWVCRRSVHAWLERTLQNTPIDQKRDRVCRSWVCRRSVHACLERTLQNTPIDQAAKRESRCIPTRAHGPDEFFLAPEQVYLCVPCTWNRGSVRPLRLPNATQDQGEPRGQQVWCWCVPPRAPVGVTARVAQLAWCEETGAARRGRHARHVPGAGAARAPRVPAQCCPAGGAHAVTYAHPHGHAHPSGRGTGQPACRAQLAPAPGSAGNRSGPKDQSSLARSNSLVSNSARLVRKFEPSQVRYDNEPSSSWLASPNELVQQPTNKLILVSKVDRVVIFLSTRLFVGYLI
jgi:hypothetical protein